MSHNIRFSFFTPRFTINCAIASPDAPAPFITTLTSFIFLLAAFNAFNKAAPPTIAVPCWSSWKTGIFIVRLSSSSIIKHSGALMSSKLIPPKVGSSIWHVFIMSSVFSEFNSMSKTSISANFLKSIPFPSITGFPAIAPIFPRPKTAVPLDITATRLPFAVYL